MHGFFVVVFQKKTYTIYMKKLSRQKNQPLQTFWNKQIDEVMQAVNATPQGLSAQDAELRLATNGENTIPAKRKKSLLAIILGELLNPIVILLLFACGFSAVMAEWLDAAVIMFIIIIDVIMGIMQTLKAEKTANSLLGKIKTNVKVLRNGEKMVISAKNLVIGDLVFLESGDRVPADLRLIDCQNLKVDESLLTGESLPVEKHNEAIIAPKCALAEQKNMVFNGTSVVSGRATAVVVQTALETQIGQIAEKLSSVKEELSPLQKRIGTFSKQITFGVALVAVIMFLVLYFQGNDFNSIFLFVVALAVSAIPEGLPLAVNISLSVASRKMGQKNVIVKTLNAVESLGSCTVIASDKTGTLTLNEQTAKMIVLPNGQTVSVTGSGYNDLGELQFNDPNTTDPTLCLVRSAVINTEAKLYKHNGQFKSFGDSIDIAFLALGMKAQQHKNLPQILFTVPYESEKKFSAAFFKDNEQMFCTAKGSIETILAMCSNMGTLDNPTPLDAQALHKQHEAYAKKGYRLIAVATGAFKGVPDEKNIKNLTFLGFVCFIDPVRVETKPAIKACKQAGVKVLMITGDHPLTALAIATEIGIAAEKTQITTGHEIEEMFAKGEKAFDRFVANKTVFARVTPTDKLNIINSLKRQGEFVAVTGDGVNDAPAIKSAHIGIAMGSGTDVAKETADMIISDDNFSSVVHGIKEGRVAYSNIRKVTYLLLSQGIGEILFFFISILCGLPLPLVATQILYLNIVTNGLQDFALSFEKGEKGILCETPRSTKESLFSKSLLLESLLAGLVIGGTVFGVWAVLIAQGTEITFARSIVMALMVFMQNFHTLNCRSETRSTFKQNPFGNWLVPVAVGLAIVLQIALMEVPFLANVLNLTTVPIILLVQMFALGAIILIVMEFYKYFVRKYRQKHNIRHSY